MKKHTQPHHLFFVLLVFAALVLTSCGGLSAPKQQTGDFTFTVDDNLIQAIARASTTSGDPLCTINITIKSKNPGVYDKSKTETALLSQLTGTTFVFDDLPLKTPLVLTVSVFSNNTLIYSTDPKEFTLSSADVQEIEMLIWSELNTPTMVWDQYNELTTLNENYPTDLQYPVYDYCFDANGILWLACNDGHLYSSEKGTSEPQQRLLLSHYDNVGSYTEEEGENRLYITNVKYDPITNRLCLVIVDEHADSTLTTFVASAAPEQLLREPQLLTHNLFAMKELKDFPDFIFSTFYAYNGAAYSLICEYTDNSYNELTDISIRKYAIETGDSLSTMHLLDSDSWNSTTYNAVWGNIPYKDQMIPYYQSKWNNLGDGDKSEYGNDIVQYIEHKYRTLPTQMDIIRVTGIFTYKDTVFLPFYQDFSWKPDFSINNPGFYINRGGILLLDAATLHVKDVIGMAPTETTLTVPYVSKETDTRNSYLVPVYADEKMTQPLTYTFNFNWAMGGKDGTALRNPCGIIAIKPKKLVIADTGNFYYIDETGLFTNPSSRFVTVDLETFALSFEENTDSTILPADSLTAGFDLSNSHPLDFAGEPYVAYMPKFSNGVSIDYNTPVKKEGSTYSIEAHAFFGSSQHSNIIQ